MKWHTLILCACSIDVMLCCRTSNSGGPSPVGGTGSILPLSGYIEKIELLGSGGTSNVFKVKFENQSKCVALKVIRKEARRSGKYPTAYNNQELTKLASEVHVLSLLRNIDHFANLLEICDDDDNLYLIMDIIEYGELTFLIWRQKFSLNMVRAVFLDLARALAYMHANGIMHRDIKPENVLIDCTGNAKLIDFGFAHVGLRGSDRCGSVFYLARDIAILEDGREYNHKVDIWSLGVLLYVMATQYLPFDGRDDTATLLAVIANNPNMGLLVRESHDLADAFVSMTNNDPDARPEAAALPQVQFMLDATEHGLANGRADLVQLGQVVKCGGQMAQSAQPAGALETDPVVSDHAAKFDGAIKGSGHNIPRRQWHFKTKTC